MKKYFWSILGLLRFDRLIDAIFYARIQSKIAYYRNKGVSINFINAGIQDFWIVGDITNLKIDETSHIKSGAYIECYGKVTIGRYFHVGKNLTIMSSDHDFRNSNKIPFDHKLKIADVVISDFVWIGADVTILPGVNIGEGVIIGASTVVSKDIPPLSIVVGNPCRIVGKRDESRFAHLKSINAFE